MWLHISADALIAFAYFSIPVILFYFLHQTQKNPLEKIIISFSLFILCCGTTHVMSIWTLWHPVYWLSGIIKAITALISLYTAIALAEFIPFALSMPNPQELEDANQDLAREIISRQKAEIELEQERSFLKAMLDSITDSVVACDKQGVLAIFNPASEKMFGKREPLGSQDWAHHYNLYYADGETYLQPEHIPLARAFAGETFTDAELVTIPPHAAPMKLVANGCPILDPDGNKLGALVTVKDVTRSKQAEQELQQINAELLQSNQELEQFAYVASHDLREPLRMVISFTQLLAQKYSEKLDEEADTIMSFAIDGAKRMETLIEDLLSYSRLGKQNKTFKRVNCNLIIQKALANLKVSIEEKSAVIDIKPLPHVTGDEVQLVQLFQNLINNALIYRSEIPLHIEISAVSQQQGWSFSIKDNGIGISSENNKRIFEVFQRLHPKDKYSGTGIGLAICKKIVERHGGEIWVESELGTGSTFWFTLNNKINSII